MICQTESATLNSPIESSNLQLGVSASCLRLKKTVCMRALAHAFLYWPLDVKQETYSDFASSIQISLQQAEGSSLSSASRRCQPSLTLAFPSVPTLRRLFRHFDCKNTLQCLSQSGEPSHGLMLTPCALPVSKLNQEVLERVLPEVDEEDEPDPDPYQTLRGQPWRPCQYLRSITLFCPGISLGDRRHFVDFFKALTAMDLSPIPHVRLGFACMDTLIREFEQGQEYSADPHSEAQPCSFDEKQRDSADLRDTCSLWLQNTRART